MTIDCKSYPFCGSNEIDPRTDSVGIVIPIYYHCIECKKCGAKGPFVRTKEYDYNDYHEMMVKRWNKTHERS